MHIIDTSLAILIAFLYLLLCRPEPSFAQERSASVSQVQESQGLIDTNPQRGELLYDKCLRLLLNACHHHYFGFEGSSGFSLMAICIADIEL